MSAISAKKQGYDEAIIFNEQNFVIETTSSNLFFVLNDKLFTPHLNQGCVEGTMRELIINNFNVKEIKVKMDDLINSQEIILTNSLSIKSVTELNGVPLNNSQYANRFLEKVKSINLVMDFLGSFSRDNTLNHQLFHSNLLDCH